MPPKTNAARRLDALGIPYEIRTYALSATEGGDLAARVAKAIGLPEQQVFKTLLAIGDRTGPLFAVLPGDRALDLKALAVHTGDRRVQTAPQKDLRRLTGYQRGGVTVLGAKSPFPAFLDDSALRHPRISVSAGRPGLQLLVAPDDYQRAIDATVATLRR
jgi:Cys-tRNA(Pro)/Cys-tRNA(Cys) deacylase